MNTPHFNVLVLSHFNKENLIFENYANGIRAHSGRYTYVDYLHHYLAQGKTRFEESIEQLVVDEKIDCVFFIWWSSDLTFDLSFIERLSSRTIVVMNFFDTEYYFEGVDRYYARLADFVLLPDAPARHKYKELGINALTTFSLFDKNFYRKRDDASKDIDVSFVGNCRQADRKEYLHYLNAHGVSVQTYGVGSDHGFAPFEEMIDLFNRSRINLNFTAASLASHCIIEPPQINQRIRQAKGRPIEIALSGGFALTEYAPGLEEMFVPGEEIDVFTTKEELAEKVRYYLSHEDKREAIAARGHERALRDYDAAAGFEKVFKRMKELGRSANKTVTIDREFKENFAAYRFFYILLFLFNGRIWNIPAELKLLLKHRRWSLKKSFHFAVKGFLYWLRGHPRLEDKLKSLNNRLHIRVKY